MALVDVDTAARRWAEVWTRCWPSREAEPIVALYAERAGYRAFAFREPDVGLIEIRRYLTQNFEAEEDVECWFGKPLVDGDRATVEWWANWTEGGEPVTLAGTTVLRFDDDGQVVDHRDYWNQQARRSPPYSGWRGGAGQQPR